MYLRSCLVDWEMFSGEHDRASNADYEVPSLIWLAQPGKGWAIQLFWIILSAASFHFTAPELVNLVLSREKVIIIKQV